MILLSVEKSHGNIVTRDTIVSRKSHVNIVTRDTIVSRKSHGNIVTREYYYFPN